MSELVERLRGASVARVKQIKRNNGMDVDKTELAMWKAADRIEALEAERTELREIIRTHIDPMDVRDEHHDTVEEIRHSLDDEAGRHDG